MSSSAAGPQELGDLNQHSNLELERSQDSGAMKAGLAGDFPPSSGEVVINSDGEEQALESHEVIELQTFSERKAWIEEKIKFLVNMPAIEVFVGLDALRYSAEDIPGLPTRDELKQWIAEHDAIEKETEIFDTGELKKLRQLTKAATQRNLSPEDTDVIELTLTTIYELDKLLHLLRDRSENLDLLSIRLAWEENRSASWKDRRKILDDLETFIITRARWSPAIYETTPTADDSPDPSRRGSVTSLASATSDASLSSPTFSRSARFKLAEILSRDAAQYSGRVTTLRHGTVATAGRALDKLIDNSRKPVPEELLDEQDRLEEKSINEMEHVGKFVMGLVMQWRKADEIYVETVKDQMAAQELLEEIESAKLHHPTLRQSASFISRVDVISDRLSIRGNPASKMSLFPRPEHPLFPNQRVANEALISKLGLNITTATTLCRKAKSAAKEYWDSWDAVRRVGVATTTANEIISAFNSIIQRLSNGIPDENGEGTPPDLLSEDCLHASLHSVFIALLPSIQSEAAKIAVNSNALIRESESVLFSLDANVDPSFKSTAIGTIKMLSKLQDEVLTLGGSVSKRVTRLREARRIWANMDMHFKDMRILRDRLSDDMERDCWKQESTGSGAPPTPESPVAELTSLAVAHTDVDSQVNKIGIRFAQDVESPLSSLSVDLERPVLNYLTQRAHSLRGFHGGLLELTQVLKAIQKQSKLVRCALEDCNRFLIRIEDLKIRFTSLTQRVLSDDVTIDDVKPLESKLKLELTTTRNETSDFINTLSSRISFVSRHSAVSQTRTSFLWRSSASRGKSDSLQDNIALHLPYDLSHIDAAVRADSNTYAMRLGSALESISKASAQLEMAYMSKELDQKLASTIEQIHGVNQDLHAFQTSLADIIKQPDDKTLQHLGVLLLQFDDYVNNNRSHILRCFSPMRELLRNMDTSSVVLEHSIREEVYVLRRRAVDDAELRFRSWDEAITNLKFKTTLSSSLETERLEELTKVAEQRKREEDERFAAEAAERLQIEELERERVEQRRLEEQRQAEAIRQELEKERKAAEESERFRLQQETKEAEERERREKERQAAEVRAEAEQRRIEEAEVEKALLLKERLAAEEKLKWAEAQLVEERRWQAERNRLDQLKAEEEGLRLDQEQRQKLLAEQEAESIRAREELERTWVAGAERNRLEAELELMKMERQKAFEQAEALADAFGIERTKLSKKFIENELFASPQNSTVDDVFGVASSSRQAFQFREEHDIHPIIVGLRKRLRSIGINEVLRPSSKSSNLPTQEQTNRMKQSFSVLQSDVADLPMAIENISISADLRSLRMEVSNSAELLKDIDRLVQVAEAVQTCDTALSDLLEHIDSYPSLPLSVSSLHKSVEWATPETQLLTRLAFTKEAIDLMDSRFAVVANDQRAVSERNRLQQTWTELEEMANDRIGGKKSRPVSVTSSRPSSSRSSDASVVICPGTRKKASYSNLSVSSISLKGGKLAPPPHMMNPRRALSGTNEFGSFSTSRLSTASTARSISGPLNSSILGSTFASRQRTTSLSNSTTTPSRMKATTSQSKRNRSPSMSESSTHSHAAFPPSRSSTTSTSTWARAPRNSLSSLVPRVTTPQKKMTAPQRKKYIPNPMSKLDVAVGDVVNQLPVGINVEGLSETWRDQSGKYWIGNQEPRLCFCRILRSETVMVRVGGGWTELSKFIKDHFADSFRLLPDSPPRATGKYQEEKWISSTILLEVPQETETPPAPPRTPEPIMPFVPSFSLSTPSGQSPRSMKSSPSTKGSPLMPLQFIRRAEPDAVFLRPVTPSKSPLRARNTNIVTPSRASVWRP